MFTGEKVRLREYRKEDIPLALEYINDPEIKKYLVTVAPLPVLLHNEEKWFEKISADKPEEYSFAIETLDGKYIGGCGINKIDWKNSSAEVGIFIGDKNYWGKGYGTDTMKVLVRFIFDQMNIHKVKLKVKAFNERAIRSYGKCGFKEEGVLRGEVFIDGQYHDEILMGILREEYLEIYK